MIEAGKDYLLFDGDCGICAWSADWARQMDHKSQFIVQPYQLVPEEALLRFGVNHEQCSRALQMITRRGRVHAGAFAVNYFLWRQFPWSLLVVAIYAIPIFLALEMIGYRLVANHRHRISQWLGMKACSLEREKR